LDVGTIIMGRRGLSRTQDFFMGRVTNKVVYLAREKVGLDRFVRPWNGTGELKDCGSLN
jgi:hypothetical protein